MSFFKDYADAYDALYQEKDYAKECDYVEELFRKHQIQPKTILDLGCGTGSHALILAKRGYAVTGVDRSAAMLEIARKKAAVAGVQIAFREGNVTNMPPDKKYDAVVALFSVMGLQTSNDEFAAACRTAKEALAPGGMFLFDCWNGYAVMAERPQSRTRVVDSGDGGRIERFSSSELDIQNQVVHVSMRLRKVRGVDVTETVEKQAVRFFYPQEIRYFLASAGFKDVNLHPFMSTEPNLTTRDWNMMVVGG